MGSQGVLVISQTQQVHDEIAALLAKLRKAQPSGGPRNPANRQRPWQGPPVGGGGGGMFQIEPENVPPPSVGNNGAGPADSAPQTPAERKIEKALNSPTKLEFVDTPLTDVVNYLKDYHHIDIRLDKKAMADASIEPGVTVTKNITGVSLRSALKLMRRDLGLTYVIQGDGLLITTTEVAETMLTTRTYPITDLVEMARDVRGKVVPDFDSIIDLLRGAVQPTSWEDNGGPGSIAKQSKGNDRALVISQTQEAHEEIAALLRELREAKQRAADGKEAYEPVYLSGRGPAERKIEAVLNSPTELAFKDTPLTDVADYLKDKHQIEIQLDKKAMEEASIAPETKVTCNIKGITLRSALRLMLRELGLTYVIANEALYITTTEAAEAQLTTVIYPVADLVVTGQNANGNATTDFDSLSSLILMTVNPNTWESMGAPASLPHVFIGKAHLFVISQTQEAHEEIAAFLAGLREAKRAMAGGKDKYRPVYVPKRGPAEEKIEAVLNTPEELAFKNWTLTDVIESLKPHHKIEIQLDHRAMDERSISAEVQVTKNVGKMPLRTGLRRMLDDLGLTYVIENEVLLVTTKEAAEARLTPVIYPVTDLAQLWTDDKGKVWSEYDSLIKKISSKIQPKSWVEVGGPGSIMHYSIGSEEVLVISQTQQIHEDIAALLAKPRKARTSDAPRQPTLQQPARHAMAPRTNGWSWLAGLSLLAVGICWPRRKTSCAWKIAASVMIVLLAAAAGRALAQTDAGNENARDAGPPVVLPDDAIIRPYDPAPDGGMYGSDRLLVPYARYVELWNRAHPDKKLESRAVPVDYALAGATYNTTLEGDEYLLLTGRLTIDVYSDSKFVEIPLGLRGGVLGRAQLDGKPARLRLAGFRAAGANAPSRPSTYESDNPFAPSPPPPSLPGYQPVIVQPPAGYQPIIPSQQPAMQRPAVPEIPDDALAVLYVEGKGRHTLQVEVRVRLGRAGGWRVAEATLPTAPASRLTIKAPAGQTEIRLSQVPDRRSYDTDKDGQTIETVLGGGGELALQWRPKVAEGQVDRGLTAQSTAVVDVEEDGLRAVWNVDLEFRRNQREQFQFSFPKEFLVEGVTGSNVRGWEVRKANEAGKDRTVDVSLLKPAKDREQVALHLWRSGAVGQKDLAEFDVPLVMPSGAIQASGRLTIRRSPLLDVQTVGRPGATRIDLADSGWAAAVRDMRDKSPLHIQPYQAYRFATMPFTLRLRAAPLVAKTTAEVHTLIKLAEYRPTLECRALVRIQNRPIYQVEMLLPDDLKVRNVSAAGEFQWAIGSRDKHPLLTIYYASAQRGETPVLVEGTLGGAERIESLRLPSLDVCGVESQSGDIAVQADPAFDVLARDLRFCQEGELEQVYGWLNPQQRQLTRLVLHYQQPGYRGTLRLSPRTPDVTCETISNVRVTDREVWETVLLTFTVHRGGIRELRFQLPASMAGARISSVPMLRQKSVEPADKSEGAPLRVRVELQEEMKDQILVTVENDRLLPKGTSSVPIPAVEKETGRTNRQYATLQNTGRDEVKMTAVGLEPISPQQTEWQHLRDVLHGGITQAYMVGSDAKQPELSFEMVPHEDVQVVAHGSAWPRPCWCWTPTGLTGRRRPSG